MTRAFLCSASPDFSDRASASTAHFIWVRPGGPCRSGPTASDGVIKMRIVENILRTLDVPLIVAGMIAVVVMTSWSGDEPPGSREMLLLGAEQGNVSLIQRALAQGVDIESPDEVHLTPLMLASRSGRLDAVRYLLAHGADPNRCIRISGTPLTLANGQKEVIRELLEHGA